MNTLVNFCVKVIESSELFDSHWYALKYNIASDQALHYLLEGWEIGYDPSEFFSTSEYIEMYPDVAGSKCPLLDYEIIKKEQGKPFFNRNRRILKECDISGKGLEIGPSFSPICPKSAGFDIEILDHASGEELREKYKNDSIAKDRVHLIEEVDYVWNGENYVDLIGKKEYYDYIVASNVIEHMTDFIGFFVQCAELLKEGGVLTLVIPNKHYCFDFFRENTGLNEVIAKHLLYEDKSIHTKDKIIEYNASIVSLFSKIAWDLRALKFGQFFEYLNDKNTILKSIETKGFTDLHEWVFTPGSFRILINDLWELGFIELCENTFFYSPISNEWEFYVTMKKNSNHKPSKDFNEKRRLELMEYRLNEDKYFYSKLSEMDKERALLL